MPANTGSCGKVDKPGPGQTHGKCPCFLREAGQAGREGYLFGIKVHLVLCHLDKLRVTLKVHKFAVGKYMTVSTLNISIFA